MEEISISSIMAEIAALKVRVGQLEAERGFEGVVVDAAPLFVRNYVDDLRKPDGGNK